MNQQRSPYYSKGPTILWHPEAFIWLRFLKGIVFVMGIIVGIIVGYLLGQSGWPIESSAGEVSRDARTP